MFASRMFLPAIAMRKCESPFVTRASETVIIHQRKRPERDGLFTTLGTYHFVPTQPAVVTVRNADTVNYVSMDAVQLLMAKRS